MTRKLLAAILFTILSIGAAAAQPAWVQTQFDSIIASPGTASSITFNFLHTWTAGHGLAGAFYIEFGTTGLDISSVTDNAGNTYTVLGRQADVGSTTNFLYLFGLPSVSGSPTTLTVHFTGALASPLSEYAWGEESSGAGSLDKFIFGVNSTATNTPTSGSVTTTADDLVLGFYSPDSGSGPTAGSGFTLRVNDATNGLWDETEAQGAAGSVAATFNQSTAGTGIVGLIALAPPAGGGSTADIGLLLLGVSHFGPGGGGGSPCSTNFVFDGTIPCNAIASVIR